MALMVAALKIQREASAVGAFSFPYAGINPDQVVRVSLSLKIRRP